MHVLFLPSWYPKHPDDPNGSFFREQAIALRKCDVQVGVLAPIEFQPLSEWTKARQFTSFLRVSSEDDEGMVTYRSTAVKFFARPRWLHTPCAALSYLSLFRAYQKAHGRPDVIHVNATLNAGGVACLIQKLYGIRYIVSEHHSAYVLGLISNRQRVNARHWMGKAHARFTVSSHFASYLEQSLNFASNSWNVIPNSVNELFLRYPLVKRSGENFTFIHVSLFTANKRVELILKAFASRFARRSQMQLVIGGDGVLRPRLEQLAVELGIAPQVRFTGLLSRQMVVEEMSQADAFVLGSHHETFGVVLVEAMALGKPVVATRCGGPEEIVTSEVGILVASDVESLAKGMEEVYKNYDRYRPEALRAHCQKRYSVEVITQRWLQIYGNVMKRATQ